MSGDASVDLPLVTVEAAEGLAEAIVARPDGGDRPGVLLCMDAIGLRPQIQTMAERIASWGYVVLAPNTFYRSGSAAQTTPPSGTDLRDPEQRAAYGSTSGAYLAELTGARMEDDLPFYLAALRSLSGVSTGVVGVTGYCMGARMAIRAAGLDIDVRAAAGFHGAELVTDEPDSPHRRIASARAEFLFGHADQDHLNDADAIATLEQALASAGVRHSSAIYPEAPHGFTMRDTSSYQEAGAERSFAELEPLLARTLTR